MAKKIIVPVDFSENAFAAAKFASQIAIDHDYSIFLFHCYNSETTIFDEKINVKETTTPLMRGDIIMAEWKESLLREFPTLSLETECRDGLITDVLPKIAIEPNYSLLVMGSNGLGKADSPMFGSTTSQVSTKSHIPVIAVPAEGKTNNLSQAAVLTNFKDDEIESLKKYIQLIQAPTHLDIVHVYQNSDDLAEVKQNINNWLDKIQQLIPDVTINPILKPIHYNNDKLDTIGEVVNATINEKHYDIVIVTKSRKSFFEKWFSRSISREVILELETVIFFDNN